MIRVLVADDSETTLQMLVAMLREDPEMEVVGQAKNGLEAVQLTRSLRPDVVAIDIVMPEMNGFEATKLIMIETPTPIVIISSSVNIREVQVALLALKAGALTIMTKPGGPGDRDHEAERSKFISTLKIMSQVKVVGHWPDQSGVKTAKIPRKALPKLPLGKRGGIVVVAASTGGPAALNKIFSELPGDFPVPILVVQHMAKGFMPGCAAWMGANSGLKVKVAEEGETLAPGTVYLAGDDRHMGVSDHSTILYSSADPVGGFRPSGTFLFESAAKSYGYSTLALVLTGMGNDGVAGLKKIRDAGGWIIVQDKKSSVIYGMPAEAIKSGHVDWVMPLDEIAGRLMEMIPSEAKR